MNNTIIDILQEIVDLGWDIEIAREIFEKRNCYVKIFTRDKRKAIPEFTYRISCYKSTISESDLIAMLSDCLEKIKEIESIPAV